MTTANLSWLGLWLQDTACIFRQFMMVFNKYDLSSFEQMCGSYSIELGQDPLIYALTFICSAVSHVVMCSVNIVGREKW